MFGITAKVIDESPRLLAAEKKGTAKSIRHAAFMIRKDWISSIFKAPKDVHSAAGTPVFTHRRQQYKRAIFAGFDADGDTAAIGPRFSRVGDVFGIHEFGGRFKRTTFPKRPSAGPALQRNISRIPSSFRNSIGA